MVTKISKYSDSDFLLDHAIIENPNDEQFPFHTHDVCELIFLKSGNIKAVIDGKEYKLYENSLVIFRPNLVHRIKIEDGTTYERYGILFDEKIIGKEAYSKIDKDLNVINFNGDHYIIDIFKKFDYYTSSFEGEDLGKILRNLTEEVLYNLTLVKNEDYESSYNVINPIINSAIEYIEKNYRMQTSIENICKELFISKCHLHHLFMEILKTTPKKYINTKRLIEARKLIRGGYKPHEVYSLCGFTDYGTFYRNYKNYFGHIPSKENEYEIERKLKS